MKIIVDIFGGDHSPFELVKGCVEALDLDSELKLVLSGDEQKIRAELAKYQVDLGRVEILHAPDVITNFDVPTAAIKQKKQSSLVAALERLKKDEECGALVSAGSTGAVLTGAIFKIGRIGGISRPALGAVMPTINHKQVILTDCGANVDCKPLYLAHFALMGVSYMSGVFGIENPRVGLLSVGVEDKKGNEQTKAAFKILKQLPINFVGNMEAREVLSGDYDVVVCDGFVGNICIKSIEGASKIIMGSLKEAIYASKLAKLGGVLMKKQLKGMKKRLDYNEIGGAPFLGVEKVVIKAHGASKASSIRAAILQAKVAANKNICHSIAKNLEGIDFEAISEIEQGL